MPMGIVSDSQFDSELQDSSRERPTVMPTIIDMPKKGRKPGDVNVPENLRNIIGETAVTDGRDSAIKLAESFGISPSSVSAYTNGSRSTATYDEQPDKKNIKQAREKVSVRAIHKLNLALNAMTRDKLTTTKARDLAAIAKDMSVVSKNMTGEGDTEGRQTPQIIFYAPQFRDERSYETTVVKDDY
jgi:predicted transcriptional regulator